MNVLSADHGVRPWPSYPELLSNMLGPLVESLPLTMWTRVKEARPVVEWPERLIVALRPCEEAQEVATEGELAFILVESAAYDRNLGAGVLDRIVATFPSDVMRVKILPEQDRDFLLRRGLSPRPVPHPAS